MRKFPDNVDIRGTFSDVYKVIEYSYALHQYRMNI